MMVRSAMALALACDPPDRQLRLLESSPEERAKAASGGPAPSRPQPADEPVTAPEQTLAEYLGEVVVGSPCFCCGEDLVAADGGLACPVCGAAIRREAA